MLPPRTKAKVAVPRSLLFNQLGDLFDQTRLVQLVRKFSDHDLLTTTDLVDVFDQL